ncbi:Serine/threonine-protein kinase [Venturia nashicola]|uniref:Serine/threonine-protein kinase n=1 Tax=Venturia nashicola TaxID=86259 RepID=A0A4Z1PHA5_9PEZI|nr:Serine/threonine-protein kinase [Venturia nashicola]
MATQAEVQGLLRFLTGWAKLPLPVAMGKIKELQKAELTTPESIASSNPQTLKSIFLDEKLAKQVLNAAKRSNKKRANGESDAVPSPPKKKVKLEPGQVQSPAEIEASLSLPESTLDEEELSKSSIHTNRAPLVLAFAVTMLKHTMPSQPLSSRLSLAQAIVSANSRTKAANIGLESGKSAEEEGWGEGWLKIRVMGREIRAMRRWGYDPTRTSMGDVKTEAAGGAKVEEQESKAQTHESGTVKGDLNAEDETPLWGIDLEALKKKAAGQGSSTFVATGCDLPIYTPQSARAYLLKSFETPPEPARIEESSKSVANKAKKPAAASAAQEKERNLGILLRTLDIVFSSWSDTLDKAELDRRAWAWYVRVRPEVQSGVAGWGAKGTVKMENLLELKRDFDEAKSL